MSRIVLHIGTYKTGSTAIQAFMRKNSSILQSYGVIYPVYRGDAQSHTFLRQAIRTNNKEGLAECVHTLERALEEHSGATVVLSSEHFWPMNGSDLQIMLTALQRVCPDVRVLMYVRSQGRLWASLYAQQSKSMSVRPEHRLWGANSFIGTHIANHGMYYFECLEEYAKKFGRDHVSARIYDRRLFPDADVVKDFLQFLDCPVPSTAQFGPHEANSSYGWKAVEFSKYCAILLGERRYKNHPAPGALRRTVTRLSLDDKFPGWLEGNACFLSAYDQMQIRDHYADSNRKLYAYYFGGVEHFLKEDLMPVCPRLSDIPELEIQRALKYMGEFLSRSDIQLPIPVS